jgi:hypothetical protein
MNYILCACSSFRIARVCVIGISVAINRYSGGMNVDIFTKNVSSLSSIMRTAVVVVDSNQRMCIDWEDVSWIDTIV